MTKSEISQEQGKGCKKYEKRADIIYVEPPMKVRRGSRKDRLRHSRIDRQTDTIDPLSSRDPFQFEMHFSQ